VNVAGTMRGTVITVRQLGPGVANLTVEMPDVLPMGEYEDTYATPSQEANGTFKVFQIGVSNNYRWRASGIFTRPKNGPSKLEGMRRWQLPSVCALIGY
jgi:hypothetical protein